MVGNRRRRSVRIAGAIVFARGAVGCSSATDSPMSTPTPQSSPSSDTVPISPRRPILYQSDIENGDRIHLGTNPADAHMLVANTPSINDVHPDWSPDGERVTFAAETLNPPRKDIWTAAADGGSPAELYHSPDNRPWSEFPAWSPDGTQIVAVGYALEPNVEVNSRSALILIDVATGKADEISVLNDVHQVFGYPRWAPSGDALVVSIGRFTDDDSLWNGEAIAILERTEAGWSQPKIITPFTAFASYPDWHPNEDLIVFATSDGGLFHFIVENNPLVEGADRPPADLFTIKPDGTQMTPLTAEGPAANSAGQPSWTPEGRIIFTYRPPGMASQPAVINPDGSNFESIDLYATHPRERPTQ